MVRVMVVLLLSTLVLCTSYYREYTGDIGYTDLVMSRDRVEVTYVGPESFTVTQAKKYALVRSAEIAERRGYEFLKILETLYGEKKSTSVEEGRTEITERVDSTGRRRVDVLETPGRTDIIIQPSVTLISRMSPDSLEGSIRVDDIMDMAKSEEILTD